MISNNPPRDSDSYLAELAQFAAALSAWAQGVVNARNAGDLRDLIGSIDKIAKAAEKDRKALKEPYLAQGRKIDAEFARVAERADNFLKPLKAMLTGFLQAEERRKRDEAETAQKAAEEKARLADILKDDELFGERAISMANEAQQVAGQAQRLAQHNAVKGDESDRALGLRTYRKAKIVNAAMLVGHFAGHPDVIALCERLANAAIRSGMTDIPGVEVVEEKRVG